MLYIVEISD